MGQGFQVNLRRVLDRQGVYGQQASGQRIKQGQQQRSQYAKEDGHGSQDIDRHHPVHFSAHTQQGKSVQELAQGGMLPILGIVDNTRQVAAGQRPGIGLGRPEVDRFVIVQGQPQCCPRAQEQGEQNDRDQDQGPNLAG